MIPILASVLCSPLLQGPLVNHAATSFENKGVLSAPSLDAAIAYHARGPRVYELDLAYMRANLTAGAGTDLWDDAAIPGAVHFVGSSITSLADVDDSAQGPGGRYLWVGAGDDAVIRIERGTGTVPGPGDAGYYPTGGKWVFDLAVDRDTDTVYAALGAKDQSELWILDGTATTPPNVIDLTPANGFPSGTAYGLALETFSAGVVYVAMGEGGAIRLDTTVPVGTGTTVLWEPDAGAVPQTHRARDVASGRYYVYVAAERAGVVSVNMSEFGIPGYTPTVVVPRLDPGSEPHYPIRVDASVDGGTGDVVVAVGAAARPSILHEWGNFISYGNFNAWLGPLGVEAIPPSELALFQYPPGAPNAFFLYTQERASNVLEERASVPMGSGSVLSSWKSLDVVEVEGDHWIQDDEITLQRFEYDKFGGSSTLEGSQDAFHPPFGDHTHSISTQLEPNFLLTGHDGASRGHYAVRGAPGAVDVDLVPGTLDDKYYIGLFAQETWLAGNPTYEWAGVANVNGGPDGASEFGVVRFQPDTTGAALTWNYWRVSYPQDPYTGELGRGYRTITSAFEGTGGDDLMALHRTGVVTSVALYRPSALMAAATSGGLLPDGADLDPMANLAFDQLLVHDEVLGTTYEGGLSAHRSILFEWTDPATTTSHLVLAATAGSNIVQTSTSPDTFEQHEPKVVFFDLEDCRDSLPPLGHCGAAFDPTDPMSLAYEPEKRRVALGSAALPFGKSFGVTVATVDGLQLAFTANTDGSVSAFDLSDLFPTPPAPPLDEAARWQMSPSVLDGAPVPCSDVVHRQEHLVRGGPLEDVLYVAGNRRGVVRVSVDVIRGGGGPPTVVMTELGTINTPGQPSGLSIAQVDLGAQSPVDVLVVADHGSAGVKIYSE